MPTMEELQWKDMEIALWADYHVPKVDERLPNAHKTTVDQYLDLIKDQMDNHELINKKAQPNPYGDYFQSISITKNSLFREHLEINLNGPVQRRGLKVLANEYTQNNVRTAVTNAIRVVHPGCPANVVELTINRLLILFNHWGVVNYRYNVSYNYRFRDTLFFPVADYPREALRAMMKQEIKKNLKFVGGELARSSRSNFMHSIHTSAVLEEAFLDRFIAYNGAFEFACQGVLRTLLQVALPDELTQNNPFQTVLKDAGLVLYVLNNINHFATPLQNRDSYAYAVGSMLQMFELLHSADSRISFSPTVSVSQLRSWDLFMADDLPNFCYIHDNVQPKNYPVKLFMASQAVNLPSYGNVHTVRASEITQVSLLDRIANTFNLELYNQRIQDIIAIQVSHNDSVVPTLITLMEPSLFHDGDLQTILTLRALVCSSRLEFIGQTNRVTISEHVQNGTLPSNFHVFNQLWFYFKPRRYGSAYALNSFLGTVPPGQAGEYRVDFQNLQHLLLWSDFNDHSSTAVYSQPVISHEHLFTNQKIEDALTVTNYVCDADLINHLSGVDSTGNRRVLGRVLGKRNVVLRDPRTRVNATFTLPEYVYAENRNFLRPIHEHSLFLVNERYFDIIDRRIETYHWLLNSAINSGVLTLHRHYKETTKLLISLLCDIMVDPDMLNAMHEALQNVPTSMIRVDENLYNAFIVGLNLVRYHANLVDPRLVQILNWVRDEITSLPAFDEILAEVLLSHTSFNSHYAKRGVMRV